MRIRNESDALRKRARQGTKSVLEEEIDKDVKIGTR